MSGCWKPADVRACCPKCGRFVPWEALGGKDFIDPGAYYGIGTEEWTDCPKCGRVEGVSTVITRVVPLDDSECCHACPWVRP